MAAYYNEFDPYAAQWLRNLIAAGHIAPGEVDERSIVDVQPDDLHGFTQCHFFAGIGGWSLAARRAGWPDSRPLWTGSCPCQPYSLAGKGLGQKDERDLWPVWFGLVAAIRPATVMGEQVKDAIGKHWLDRMRVDLEGQGYALGATVLPACAVDAPHRRDRLFWFVADACGGRRGEQGERQDQQPRGTEAVGSGDGAMADAFAGAEWLTGADGKARRFEPSIRLLAHGVPARVGKLRAYGNAIVPQVAAEVIRAYMEAYDGQP